jgi:hypothetical protein
MRGLFFMIVRLDGWLDRSPAMTVANSRRHR